MKNFIFLCSVGLRFQSRMFLDFSVNAQLTILRTMKKLQENHCFMLTLPVPIPNEENKLSYMQKPEIKIE